VNITTKHKVLGVFTNELNIFNRIIRASWNELVVSVQFYSFTLHIKITNPSSELP